MDATAYTVKQVAQLTRITVRTLHYYDEIQLLVPTSRTDAGYRLYNENDLMRLQQILLYREMDVPLAEIRRILDAPDFDGIRALRMHRLAMKEQLQRTQKLITTIDKTLQRLEGSHMPISDQELYEGFSPEQKTRVRDEAIERYGEHAVVSSERRVRKLSRDAWEALQEEAASINQALADLLDRDPADPEVQSLIARHHATIEPFYHATADIYRGLGILYIEHPEFRAHYEKVAIGLPEFLCKGMAYYADHILAKDELAKTS